MSAENKNTNTDQIKDNTTIQGEYKTVKAEAPKRTVERKPSWLGRKYLKIKKALADFWVVGRYGFQLGGIAGLILGFCVGGFESIRMKSFWPLPIAMIGSGITFGSIFAISTVLRSNGNKDGQNLAAMQIVYFDEAEGKFKRKVLPMVFNFNEMKMNRNDKI